jgi:hypothetical protein
MKNAKIIISELSDTDLKTSLLEIEDYENGKDFTEGITLQLARKLRHEFNIIETNTLTLVKRLIKDEASKRWIKTLKT